MSSASARASILRTFLALCFVSRHLLAPEWFSLLILFSASLCSQIGISRIISLEKVSPSGLAWYFFTVSIKSLRSLGVLLLFLVGTVHDCRKMFCFAVMSIFGPILFASCEKMAPATLAQSARVRLRLRYNFSHMTLIASFLASRSRSFLPPILLGPSSVSLFTGW